METYELVNDGNPDVRFEGEVIAEVRNRWRNGNEQTRWTEITIYRTQSGKYVIHDLHRTLWQGEGDTSTVHVCDTDADVIATLGHSDLAKEAYASAGIEDVVTI